MPWRQATVREVTNAACADSHLIPRWKMAGPSFRTTEIGRIQQTGNRCHFYTYPWKKHGSLALLKNTRYSECSVWRKWRSYKRLNQDAFNSSVLEAILQYQLNAYIILLKLHPRLKFLHSLFTSQPVLLNTNFIFSWWPKCNPVGNQVG